jgi:soluble lytic murein transglycosylase-like protein
MTAAVEGLGSATAAVARVAELQSLIAEAGAGGHSGTGGFSAQLATATAVPTPANALPGAAVASASADAGATPFAAQIEAAAARYGIDPALLTGLIRAESNFDPDAGSPAGAQGLTQLMPETARSLGVTDPTDPAQSIDGGARFLSEQLKAFGGDPELALAAYNAGPGAVQQYGGVPPYAETQAYVKRVLAYAAEYGGAPAGLGG